MRHLRYGGNPKSMKEMVYIKDFVHLVDCCLKTDNMYGIYNVGCGKPISIEDQIHLIADTFCLWQEVWNYILPRQAIFSTVCSKYWEIQNKPWLQAILGF